MYPDLVDYWEGEVDHANIGEYLGHLVYNMGGQFKRRLFYVAPGGDREMARIQYHTLKRNGEIAAMR